MKYPTLMLVVLQLGVSIIIYSYNNQVKKLPIKRKSHSLEVLGKLVDTVRYTIDSQGKHIRVFEGCNSTG
jgi:hypothetical protein